MLKQWFSYRKRDRARPLMGDRRPPSPLGNIQPDHWIAEYTTDLIDLLHVLGGLIALEPAQQDLLETICAGPLIDAAELAAAVEAARAAAPAPTPLNRSRTRRGSASRPTRRKTNPDQHDLLD